MQRGQVMILYALLIPLLILFVGVGIDLGWYYLNVSRLQNAADASAIAGAHALIENDAENFSSYGDNVVLVGNFYGGDEPDSISTAGDATAADYALKNLSSDASVAPVIVGDITTAYKMNDNWGIVGSSEITMTPNLYKVGEIYYYVVAIEEKIHHMFLSGLFDAMNAPVTAIAMLTKSSDDDTGGGTDNPIPTPSPVTLIFDSNGGTFGDNTTTDSKSLTNPTFRPRCRPIKARRLTPAGNSRAGAPIPIRPKAT